MSFKYPLATATWDQAEYDALQRVIQSGMFTMGPQVLQFEKDFAAYVGAQYSVMVNSGSSANLLMVAALACTKNPRYAIKPGDEVIVPAVSWATTYYPLHQYGLTLKFVDIDLETLNFDLEALRAAITDKTRLIMAVNLLGNPNDFDAIEAIVGDREITLLEDNCESLGARLNGKQAGTFGLMGSYSTFFSHHMSTMEGGLISTDDEEMYHLLLSLRAHGWTRNLPKFNHVVGEKGDDPFKESFRFVLPGYNVRPLEMSGALGIEQLKKLPGMVAARRENAAKLQRSMGDHPKFMIQREIGESSWFGFSLMIRRGINMSRDQLVSQLNERGFEVRPIVAGNFARNEVVKYFNFEIAGELSNADHLDQNGIFVGNHHYAIDDAINELGSI